MMKAKAVIVILVALLAAPAVGSGMTVGSGPALGGSGATVAVGSGMTTAIGSGLSVTCYSGLTVAVGKVPGDWDSPYDLPPTTALQIPVTALLQYQRVKTTRGSAFAPFRKYGLRPIAAHDANVKLWGYHVAIDTTRATAPCNVCFLVERLLPTFCGSAAANGIPDEQRRRTNECAAFLKVRR